MSSTLVTSLTSHLGDWGGAALRSVLAVAEGSGAAAATGPRIDSGSFWLPRQASTWAAEHDTLFYFIYYLCLLFFVLIVAAMIHFAVKYKYRDENQKTSPLRGSHKLELWWSVIPSILLLVIFVWGFRGYISMSVPPADALEVRVTASQWRWAFQYPRPGCPSERLVVPVNTPIKLTMSSTDVIHSFYVPAFRIKRDVLPNRYTTLWFEATEVGEYDVLCTEYCGTRHSTMVSTVQVVPQEEYEAYLDSYCGLANLDPVQYGEVLFNNILPCSQCHAVTPEGGPTDGPRLHGIFGHEQALEGGGTVVVDDNYIRDSIMNPNAQIAAGFRSGLMPSFRGQIREEQLNALIDYLRSLGSQE